MLDILCVGTGLNFIMNRADAVDSRLDMGSIAFSPSQIPSLYKTVQ